MSTPLERQALTQRLNSLIAWSHQHSATVGGLAARIATLEAEQLRQAAAIRYLMRQDDASQRQSRK